MENNNIKNILEINNPIEKFVSNSNELKIFFAKTKEEIDLKNNLKSEEGLLLKSINSNNITKKKKKKKKLNKNYATRTDSIAVYNQAVKVKKYYKNENRYDYTHLSYDSKWYKHIENDEQLLKYSGTSNTILKNWTMWKAKIPLRVEVDENRYFQRESANSMLDQRAPMPLYDRRIDPTLSFVSKNIDKNDPLYGDWISVVMYDPISVKPFDLLTDQEKSIRYKRHGINGTPEWYRQKKIAEKRLTEQKKTIKNNKIKAPLSLNQNTSNKKIDNETLIPDSLLDQKKIDNETLIPDSLLDQKKIDNETLIPDYYIILERIESPNKPWRFPLKRYIVNNLNELKDFILSKPRESRTIIPQYKHKDWRYSIKPTSKDLIEDFIIKQKS